MERFGWLSLSAGDVVPRFSRGVAESARGTKADHLRGLSLPWDNDNSVLNIRTTPHDTYENSQLWTRHLDQLQHFLNHLPKPTTPPIHPPLPKAFHIHDVRVLRTRTAKQRLPQPTAIQGLRVAVSNSRYLRQCTRPRSNRLDHRDLFQHDDEYKGFREKVNHHGWSGEQGCCAQVGGGYHSGGDCGVLDT